MVATFLCVALVGVFGAFLGSEFGLPELGSILSIATGVCIIEAAKSKAKKADGSDSSAS